MRNCLVGIIHFGDVEVLNSLLFGLGNLPAGSKIVVLNHNPLPLTGVLRIENLELIENPENPGFGSGMNSLLRLAIMGNYKCFIGLNNDLIVTVDSLETLMGPLFEEKYYTLQGFLTSETGEILQGRNKIFPYWFMTFSPDRKKLRRNHMNGRVLSTDFVCGAYFAINLDCFKKAPVWFDEKIFLYHEDIDWSLRVLAQKGKIGCVPEASAIHIESAALGKGSLRGIKIRWNSLKYFLSKIESNFLARLLAILWFAIRMLYTNLKYVQFRKHNSLQIPVSRSM